MYQFFGTSGNVFIKYRNHLRLFNNSNRRCKCIRQLFCNSINECFLQKLVLYVCIFSFVISNLGLSLLIKITLPVLIILYPITIILIFVSFIDKYTKRKPSVYIGAMIAAFIISCIHALDNVEMIPNFIANIVHTIPFTT